MSDEMGDKFKQIAEMLGQNSNTNIPDNVKGLLNMFIPNTGTKEESPSGEESPRTDTDDAADMSRKMKKAMNMLNTANDPKMTLLNAIKPYLNKDRQRKLQTCMKLIKIGGLTKILDDSDEQSV